MKKFNSIKHHVQALLLGLAVGLTLIFSLITLITAYVVEDHLIYKILNQQAIALQNQINSGRKDSFTLAENAMFYKSINQAPAWVSKALNPENQHGEIFTEESSHYHFQVIPFNGSQGLLLVEVSSLLVVSGQKGIILLCLLGFLAAIILSAVVAIYLSRRIVNPILALTAAVKRTNAGDASPSMPSIPYEMGYLSKTFENTLAALSKALIKEKDFATNVSHELRTPLSIVRNVCGLIMQRGYKPKDLKTLNREVKNMQNTIDALMRLARDENTKTQSCQIKTMLENLIISEQLEIPQHWNISLNVPDSAYVEADPHLLEILLINLIKNAVDYAATPSLNIELNQSVLSLKNDHQPKLQSTNTSLRTYNSGIGQGLYLSTRIAEYQKWRLHSLSTAEGFEVSLDFKPCSTQWYVTSTYLFNIASNKEIQYFT